jgi:glycosyltransferase involved in cell wall biosynthesis|tara:strand:- start:556 stop:1554 length:999 start_codon:yes stop_codon:yes gene_type:complete
MKVTFFCRVERDLLGVVEFYRQDIEILEELGCELTIATRWQEIDWSSDVIFVWWWTYASFPVLIGKLLRKRIVITGTFNYRCPAYENDYDKRNLIKRLLIRYAARNATVNVLVSMREHDALKEDWGLTNLFYSPHTVKVTKYSYSDNREDALVFTVSGMTEGIIRRKRIMDIIAAAKALAERGRKCRFVIAGRSGDGYKKLQEAVSKNGLDSLVKLIPDIEEEEKIRYMQSCTIYLQPSRYEGFGLAIAEAMSCGAPVISSDVGAVKEVVGEAGILLEQSYPSAIADAVEHLLEVKELQRRLGQLARGRIVKLFPEERRRADLKNILGIEEA